MLHKVKSLECLIELVCTAECCNECCEMVFTQTCTDLCEDAKDLCTQVRETMSSGRVEDLVETSFVGGDTEVSDYFLPSLENAVSLKK